MPSYWWECPTCQTKLDFPAACGVRGVVHFLWDLMIPSNWDQSLLIRVCPACKASALRITYEFPRENREVIRVVQMVGIGPSGDYLPMMWETSPSVDLATRWIDFKYVRGRNIWGLNKAAVFTKEDLRSLFRLYTEKTGNAFP